MDRGELKKIKESLWKSAIKLRASVGGTHLCAEICLNLIFLKYISEKFDKLSKQFEEEKKKIPKELLRDEKYLKNWYVSKNALYIPKDAHWKYINENRNKEEIKKILDESFETYSIKKYKSEL